MAKRVEPVVIHPSTLTRLSCRLAYEWGKEYRTRTPATALSFGLCIHEALEEYYGRGTDLQDTFMQSSVQYKLESKDHDLGMAMLANYKAEYVGKERLTVLATEKEIARKVPVPFDEDPNDALKFYVAARVDGIVTDHRTGLDMVLEHKTFKNFYPGSLDMDHQFVIEAFVAEGFLKSPVSGVIYNGLRKKAKPGGKTNLFERHNVFINPHQVKVAMHRVYWTMKAVFSKQFRVYPEPSGLKCNMCQFKNPCGEYMRGGDYLFYLENAYEKRNNESEDEEWQKE